MELRENVDVELKEMYSKTILREIVAFANTSGGTIYVGIDDNGNVKGVEDADDTMLRISNIVRDNILPEVVPFIQIKMIRMEGKPVIEITVSIGTERPYYLREKGLTPEGVFVRRGTACQPLGLAGIREMIAETSGKAYEEGRSLVQDLTFHAFEQEMQLRNLEYGVAQMKTLRMIGADGLYTNLALLLSEQCPYTIKVAVFQGKDKTLFRDRKEFSGSLLTQLQDVYHFLDMYNKTKAEFSGLYRNDRRDYPEEALREALLNSILHRDYSFSGSTIINMFDDHIEFSSLGGLVNGLSMDAIFMGVSQSRNPNLASVFYRMRLVESYGTGIDKIRRFYAGYERQPVFQAAEGAFLVKLYNKNEMLDNVLLEREEQYVGKKQRSSRKADYTEEKGEILAIVKKQESITRKEVEEILGIRTTKAFRILKEMCEEGSLIQGNSGRNSCYYSAN